MKQKITKSAIDALQTGQSIADTNPIGFVARRLPSGAVTYGYRYRDKESGQQRWIGLGLHGELTPDQARRKALKVAGEAKDGGEPVSAAVRAAKRRQAASHTVDELLNNFVARHARPNLRSVDQVERIFRVYVRPRLGSRSIYDLRRRDVVELLDAVEDNHGPVMADRVLANMRKAFNWQASRDDEFTPPVVKGMARTKPKERARTRILDDQEIRDLWTALDSLDGQAPGCFPAFVRALLLSGQRLRMVSLATVDEINGRDWAIPAIRNKGKVDHLVPLTDTLNELFKTERKNGYVFSSDRDGKRSFSGFSKAKAALDRKLAEVRKQHGRPAMKAWSYHDLRRSCRSLLSRAGVSADIGERLLGHVIPGVRGVYDRYEYRKEKLAALEKLGVLVERILHPSKKVVHFQKAR